MCTYNVNYLYILTYIKQLFKTIVYLFWDKNGRIFNIKGLNLNANLLTIVTIIKRSKNVYKQ